MGKALRVPTAPKLFPNPQTHFFFLFNCMLDVMASGDDSRTDRQVDHESMAQELNSVLHKVLKDREIQILTQCFGIGYHEKDLEEIGDQLGLNRERVRQIREKSIAKLSDSGNAKILMKYLG